MFIQRCIGTNYWIYCCNRYLVDQHVTNTPEVHESIAIYLIYHIFRIEHLSDAIVVFPQDLISTSLEKSTRMARLKLKFNKTSPRSKKKKTRLFKYYCTMIVYSTPSHCCSTWGLIFPSRGRNENIGRQELVQCDSWCVNRALVPGNSQIHPEKYRVWHLRIYRHL